MKHRLQVKMFSTKLTTGNRQQAIFLLTFTDILVFCVDYLWIIVIFLAAVWALNLTAPIHCKESHLHLRWPDGEYIATNFHLEN